MEVTTQRARLCQADNQQGQHPQTPHSQQTQYVQLSPYKNSHYHHYNNYCHSHMSEMDVAASDHLSGTPQRGRRRRRSPMPAGASSSSITVPFPLRMTSASDEAVSGKTRLRAETPSGGSGTFRGRQRHRSPMRSISRSPMALRSVRSLSRSVSTRTPRSRSRESTVSAWHRAAIEHRRHKPAQRRNRAPSRSVSVDGRANTPSGMFTRRRRRQRTRSRPRNHYKDADINDEHDMGHYDCNSVSPAMTSNSMAMTNTTPGQYSIAMED